MRVAIVTHSLSRLGGGIPSVLQPLTRALTENENVEVNIHGLRDKFHDQDYAAWGRIACHAHQAAWPNSLGRTKSMEPALRSNDADLFHTHGIFKFTSACVQKTCQRKKIPYIVSPHGMLDPWALRNSRLKKRLASMWFESKHLKHASCFHALCSSEAQSIASLGYTQPIFVVPNAIDLPPHETSLTERRKEILFLGRIHPKKGLLPLLHAWNLLSHSASDWNLKIAGWNDGDHGEEIRNYVQQSELADRVKFVGPLFGKDKQQAFRSASAFILPSFSEGLPMTILEAWAHSLPVLMTEHCNLPEGFVTDAAIRIQPDSKSIAQGLRQVLTMTKEERQLMGRAGYSLIQDRFTWPKVAQQYAEIYRWMLGGCMPQTRWCG